MLEAGDPPIHHFGHFVEDLFAPPGDGHVEGVIGAGLAGLVVPHFQRFEQALVRIGQAEIHHHGGAARQSGPRAALEVVGRISAHERHFEMGMWIDPTRHDVAARGVQHLVAGQILPDLDDHIALNFDISLIGQIGGDDGTVLDDLAHCTFPVLEAPSSVSPCGRATFSPRGRRPDRA